MLAEEDLSADRVQNLYCVKRPMRGILSEKRAQSPVKGMAPDIASAVMIPLVDGKLLGALIFCAKRDHSHAGLSTLFSGSLGELVSRAVITHLKT